jgi:hypothetical protein
MKKNKPTFERFEVCLLIGGYRWVLEWEWIGEGDLGNYDPKDPDDTPRLRATLKVDGKQVVDGSYCTLASPHTPKVELEASAMSLLRDVGGHETTKGLYENEVHVNGAKRKMEAWTWTRYTR